MSGLFQSLWQGIFYLLYPELCLSCYKSLLDQEKVLCIGCLSTLPLTNYHHISENETALRFAGRFRFENASSFAYFSKEGLLQNLLHEFKYNGNKKIGIWLAKLLAQSLKNTDWIKDVDIIIPIPLYKEKYARRGFNQSEVIVKELAMLLHKEWDNSAILRVIDTESQTNKSREERSENLKGAFQLVSHPQHFTNKHLLVVDDVLTTGATIEACVEILKDIPEVKISILTIGLAI